MKEGRLRALGVASWSLLGTLLLVVALLWTLTRVWIVVPPVVIAIAILYLLNPVVTRLHARGMARWMGSCLSYLILMGFLTLIGFLVFPSLADQGRDLADDFPTIYDKLVADLEDFASGLGIGDLDLPSYEELRDNLTGGEGDFFAEQFRRLTDVTLSVLEAAFLLLLAPVIAFYLLLDLPKVRSKVISLVPERHRVEVVFVARELGLAVGGFLRGQLLVALIVGVMTSVGFWAVGLPFWLLIGMIAGLLNIIPFIGPWVGGTLGVLVALATRDLQTAAWAGLVALIVQQIDNHFVSPTVLRATVRIHPAMIILGLVLGASLGGFWGVVLAVPVMASVKIVGGHLWRTRVLGESWAEASEALIEENPLGESPIERILHHLDDGSPETAQGEAPPPVS
ncbi:MAG TPA: AI-2E family transporter [Acidimicrobiia bacterium]|nr:AI-2E family transporter [Acidimicrobiia bacterium]